MAESAFCGVDVGTQGVRAVVVDATGRELAAAARPLPTGHRDGSCHEQRPDHWWDALVGSVAAAMAASGAADRVEALALDATSGTVVLEAADGSPRGPALMYDDARAAAEGALVAEVGAALWAELGYRMQATWALPKVLWLLSRDGVGADDRVVHQSDHLVRRLTGHAVATDTSHALKTGADLRDASWPAAIHEELGLAPGRLPDLVLPGTVLGEVSREAARATGLRAGTAVRAGMTDGCAAQIAAGALEPGSWSSALGTTLVVKGATDDLVRDPHGAVYCHRHPDGGWLPGGASSTGAGILAREFPGVDLAALTDRAHRHVPVGGATYPLAGTGERFPFVAADAHGFLSEHAVDDAQRFAALCQGIAYVERLAYDVLAALGADVSGTVSLTGGAVANHWWSQLRTDVLGRTTLQPASAEAATGMAVLAAAAPGRLAETALSMVRITTRLEPDAERGRALQEGYVALVEELTDRGWLADSVARAVLGGTEVRR